MKAKRSKEERKENEGGEVDKRAEEKEEKSKERQKENCELEKAIMGGEGERKGQK